MSWRWSHSSQAFFSLSLCINLRLCSEFHLCYSARASQLMRFRTRGSHAPSSQTIWLTDTNNDVRNMKISCSWKCAACYFREDKDVLKTRRERQATSSCDFKMIVNIKPVLILLFFFNHSLEVFLLIQFFHLSLSPRMSWWEAHGQETCWNLQHIYSFFILPCTYIQFPHMISAWELVSELQVTWCPPNLQIQRYGERRTTSGTLWMYLYVLSFVIS